MAQFRKENKKYRVVVRHKGYYKSKTFENKDEAKIWARDTEILLKKGVKNLSPNIILSVSDLIEDFKKNRADKYSHFEKYEVMYNWWKNRIGHINVDEVNSGLLNQCQNILINEAPSKPYKDHKKKSNSTVRKYMFCLSAVLKYAVRLGLIQKNPMSDVEKPKKAKGIVRFLSDEERKILTSACKKHSEDLFLFVTLAIFTGGRYNELRTLKVENCDFKNNMVRFLETKNGESRGVPVYIKIMNMLEKYIKNKEVDSGYIFLNKKGNLIDFKAQYEKIVSDLKIPNLRFHDLRHTYASYLATNGAELLEIAELMGHKSLNQVRVYAHLTKKHTSRIVEQMSKNMLDYDII